MADWSAIRKKLEEDYLCPALRGRIQYFITMYRESHDRHGRAAIRFDGVEVLKSSYIEYLRQYNRNEEELERTQPGMPGREQEELLWNMTESDGCIDEIVFYSSFDEFDNQSIVKSLESKRPLVRVFALLDRRVGKRRLLAMRECMHEELDWVRMFYHIRMEAEEANSTQKSKRKAR